MTIFGFLTLSGAALIGIALYKCFKVFLAACYWAGHDSMFVATHFKQGVTFWQKCKAVAHMFFFTFGRTIRDRLNGFYRAA